MQRTLATHVDWITNPLNGARAVTARARPLFSSRRLPLLSLRDFAPFRILAQFGIGAVTAFALFRSLAPFDAFAPFRGRR